MSRFTPGLEDEVLRSGWIVLAYCWMPNHIHALLQTPEPNLASGMQPAREWDFGEARREKVFHAQWTGATLSQLDLTYGLTGTDGVAKLVRRAVQRQLQSAGRTTPQRVQRLTRQLQ